MGCKCLTAWGDWINSFCAGAGDEEEGGEACCKLVTDTLKQWVSPAEKRGFMRTLLCPILESESYQKLKDCKNLAKVVYAIGILGFVICLNSFFAKPWWNQVQGCIGEDCACPVNWKIVVIMLYLKALALNIMGVITSLGLVYGLYCNKPDYFTMWLMWRTAVVCLGIITFLLIFAFSHFSPQNLSAESCNELMRVFVNVGSYLAVLAYTEQDNDEGGVAEDVGDAGEGDEFIPAEAKEVLSTAIY